MLGIPLSFKNAEILQLWGPRGYNQVFFNNYANRLGACPRDPDLA